MGESTQWFAIKVRVDDLCATAFRFVAQKTMYGGKGIGVGDAVFVFASENEGGAGLFARGVVCHSEAIPRTAAARQTPRVSISIKRNGTARQSFGRAQARRFRGAACDLPEAEIDFKLYRQATDKIVGLTDRAGEFLNGLF